MAGGVRWGVWQAGSGLRCRPTARRRRAAAVRGPARRRPQPAPAPPWLQSGQRAAGGGSSGGAWISSLRSLQADRSLHHIRTQHCAPQRALCPCCPRDGRAAQAGLPAGPTGRGGAKAAAGRTTICERFGPLAAQRRPLRAARALRRQAAGGKLRPVRLRPTIGMAGLALLLYLLQALLLATAVLHVKKWTDRERIAGNDANGNGACVE